MPDIDIRTQVAQLLTGRCNNCYRRLPGNVGCDVHSKGWFWPTENFGPFCDECMDDLRPLLTPENARRLA